MGKEKVNYTVAEKLQIELLPLSPMEKVEFRRLLIIRLPEFLASISQEARGTNNGGHRLEVVKSAPAPPWRARSRR